ncbi:MAG: hypothetical protein EHM45_09970 [Desulfobacteraceae bacterium]|nr:MAG: hypothetical protein EHM45_09970 [Desulfobacteraceae bacterium]
MGRFFKFAFFVLLGGFIYWVLSYHFIFFDSMKPYQLKKQSLTFEDTIVNISKARSLESILANKNLRKARMGEFLVSIGRMSTEELDRINAKYED